MTHTYSIVVKTDPASQERFEIEAPGPEAALEWAEKSAPNREFEIVEDGRSLCRAMLSGEAGYWTITSSRTDNAA